MSKLRYYGMWATSLYVLFSGIRELDHSHTWIEFFRGLIWMFIGAFVIWSIPPQSGSKGDKV